MLAVILPRGARRAYAKNAAIKSGGRRAAPAQFYLSGAFTGGLFIDIHQLVPPAAEADLFTVRENVGAVA